MSGGWFARAGERLIGLPATKLFQIIQPWVGSSSSTPFSSTSEAEIERIRKDLAYVQRTWERIDVFLEDAEQREVQDKSVRMWLGDLRALTEEAEDLFDFCQYEAVSMEVQDREEARVTRTLGKRKGVDDQVCFSNKESLCNPLHDPKFRQEVVDKVQKIRDRFDEIDKLRNALNLKDCGEARINRSIIDRPPSGYLPSELNIVGREELLPQVVDVLIGGDDTRLQVPIVVALVGMGGVGKTTLAQHAFNTPAVSAHFDTKGWVCVSDEFELVSLTKKVLEAFTKEDSGLIGLSVLQEKLFNQVKGKKFLLVMDDIWNEKALLWENFLSCLRCGMTGSKILITTRSHRVAETTHAVEEIELGCLSEEDAWHLFQQCAFRRHEQSENDPKLLSIGREIAKKCKGLPLALKVLGSRLSCDPDDPSVWRDVLESTLWEPSIWEDGKQILGPLLLSYLNLPAYLKPCLRLCSVFPKDATISKDVLISLWVAHDKVVVKDRDNWMVLKAMARRYIDELSARCFLEKCYHLSMHDLIHDLVQFLTKDEHNNIGSGIDFVERTAKPGCGMRSLISTDGFHDHLNLERLRALSYGQFHNQDFCVSSLLISRILRTVSLSVDRIERTEIEQICKLYNLRELDIHIRSRKIIQFPETIGNLKNLLSLSLNRVFVQDLPQSLFLLPKLQDLSLKCENDSAFTFPNNVSNLRSLQRFIIIEKYLGYDFYLPAGFGRLRNLRVISDFAVGYRSEHAGLKELGDLVHLQGELRITRLRIASLDDSKQAGLMKMENLEDLELLWNDKRGSRFPVIEKIPILRNIMQHDEQLLENLRPHRNLRTLFIDGWRGAQLPSWLGDDPSHLTRLNTLHFGTCAGLVSLPPIGHIPTLENLIIHVSSIECITDDFFSSTLRTLDIKCCDDLTSVFLYRLSALEKLIVAGCSRLQVIRFTGPMLMRRPILGANPVITRLELQFCPLLRDVEFPPSLIIRKIQGCPLQ